MILRHNGRSGQYDDCHIALWHLLDRLQDDPDVEIGWHKLLAKLRIFFYVLFSRISGRQVFHALALNL